MRHRLGQPPAFGQERAEIVPDVCIVWIKLQGAPISRDGGIGLICFCKNSPQITLIGRSRRIDLRAVEAMGVEGGALADAH